MPPKKNHATPEADVQLPFKKVCKRSEVSLEAKIEVLEWHKGNGSNQRKTALHFKAAFPTINQSTISRWVKNSEQLESDFLKGNKRLIRRRKTKHPQFEEALGMWVDQLRSHSETRLTGFDIKEVARKFYDHLEIPECDRLELSNGWLSLFLKRHALKLLKFHGEASSVAHDIGTVDDERKRLAGVIQTFLDDGHTLNDVWNMDETSFPYAAVPDKGYGRSARAGTKQPKTHITIALAVNCSGTERLSPFFIGKAFKPRCFGGRTGQQLGFDYAHNKRAWMTAQLFGKWLHDWNVKLARENRKIILFVDNSSAHKIDMEHPNIQLEFFSPNLTPFVQPCDGGIIRAFNALYRRKFVLRTVDRLFQRDVTKDIFKIDQLTAMKFAKEAWMELKQDTISNCWKHVKILPHMAPESDDRSPDYNPDSMAEIQELQVALDTLRSESLAIGQPLCLANALEFVNMDANEAAGEELTIEEIVAFVNEPECVEGISEEEEIVEAPITHKQAFAAIIDIEKYSLQNGIQLSPDCKRFLDERTLELRVFLSRAKKRTRNSGFFKLNA